LPGEVRLQIVSHSAEPPGGRGWLAGSEANGRSGERVERQ
jgi:hypothetical protein